jgi:hypothetical protein
MLKRNVVLLIVGALVLGAGAYAWAQGAPDRPTTTAAAAQAGRPGNHRGPGGPRAGFGAGRAVHGDLIVPNRNGGPGFEHVTLDRGEVTSVSGSSITVKRADGASVTKTIDSNTKFRGAQSAGDVKPNQPAVVVSKGSKAVLVGQPNGDRMGRRGPAPGGGSAPGGGAPGTSTAQ